MLYRKSHALVVAASTLLLACADNIPTSPNPTATLVENGSIQAVRRQRATLTGAIDETVGGAAIVGTVRITRFAQSSTGQLLVSGVITGTADGVPFTQAFSDVPATLSGARATSAAVSPGMVAQLNECDILLLDLGPLHLDILGLVVDLSRVVLDIDAVAGSGNLLGNLLCAVVHLLDGPAILAAIANILDQINVILGAL